MTDFNTNQQPGFHILISLIEIWTPKDKTKPNGEASGSIMRICEVEEVRIEESYKKLIGTASVRFPRGTIVRKTISDDTADQQGDFTKVSANTSYSGVVEELRTNTSVATPDTFAVGQRIKIYLGYTTDPKIANSAKTNNVGNTIYNNKSAYDNYVAQFKLTDAESKKYMGLMFDGYITKISVDTPIELECENLASHLKTITCPNVKLRKCEVKDLIGENGRYKLLENTGLKLHPDTANMDFDLGSIETTSDLTVADVLIGWARYGLFCYVSDFNGEPAIKIGRAYFSNPGKDSLLHSSPDPGVVPIHFDYHVASNGLSLTLTDKAFLAVKAQGLTADDKFINITILPNPKYDPSKPESASNAHYRYANESKLSRKALKAGKRYLTASPNDKVDMKAYTQITFSSKTVPTTVEKLAEEATKYLEGYNTTGIEGSLTLFGDLYLRTAQQVELIDRRYPNKNGIYLVEEVSTTFGTNGFRQRITLPYCIQRKGSQNKNK